VTYTASGRCGIDADQAGDGSYAAAPQVQQTVMVVDIPRNSGVSSSLSELCGGCGPCSQDGSRDAATRPAHAGSTSAPD
jgi:hypothetical protein